MVTVVDVVDLVELKVVVVVGWVRMLMGSCLEGHKTPGKEVRRPPTEAPSLGRAQHAVPV